MNLLDAIAFELRFKNLGYPTKTMQRALEDAAKTIEQAAGRVRAEYEGNLCSECGGNGFRRISETLLSGPCERCEGKGYP